MYATKPSGGKSSLRRISGSGETIANTTAELDGGRTGPGIYHSQVPLTVRPLTLNDDLMHFGHILLASYEALPGQPHDPVYFAELIDVRHRVETDTVVGAFDEGVPLGCATYVNNSSSPHAEGLDADEASFRMLAVDVAAQGRGLGDALARACLDRARASGRRAVFIYSGEWMTAAHRLYDRLGFARVPMRDRAVPTADAMLLGFRLELT